jgi:hypothetical protein
MSDQSLSRDELASALLDDEVAGPSSVDPALAARVEEAALADAIGAPVPIDDVVREAIGGARRIGRSATSEAADTAPVAATAALPRRSRYFRPAARRGRRLLGAAAVLQRDD